MGDRVREYQDALASLVEAEQRATEIVSSISGLAQTVRDWKGVRIVGAVIRDEVTLNESLPLISPEAWPTFESFRDAVSAYHKAVRDAGNVWRNMTDAEQIGLTSPHGM